MIGPLSYGSAAKPPTACDCPSYQGIAIHWDECPVLKEAIRKHREAVESMIREHCTRAGLSRGGKVDYDQLKARCELKQYPHMGKLELWIDGKMVAEMQDIVELK